MNDSRLALTLGLCGWLAAGSTVALAQPPGIPEPMQPPQEFASSEAHYRFLLNAHRGGTRHTYESVPKWTGLWSADGNGSRTAFVQDGEIVEGILTPEYEAAFQMRLDLIEENGEQAYDRLTTCEPAGYPRFLMEPYVREFVNTPDQVWQLNDLANESRRIFIDQEHKNVDGTHFAIGDAIGFWSDDMLIVHTVDIYPNDWFRGLPPTSNQFESVEVWRLESFPNGNQRLVVNVTFYDELSLVKPLTLTYTYRRRTELEALGFRIRHWECDSNRNTYLTEDGKTQFLLPGDEGYFDIRGPRYTPDLPADLPGQERNPIFDDFVQ